MTALVLHGGKWSKKAVGIAIEKNIVLLKQVTAEKIIISGLIMQLALSQRRNGLNTCSMQFLSEQYHDARQLKNIS